MVNKYIISLKDQSCNDLKLIFFHQIMHFIFYRQNIVKKKDFKKDEKEFFTFIIILKEILELLLI